VTPACVLCQGDGGRLVWRNDRCRVILADEPDYPGFVRVIWQAHITEFSDLTAQDRQDLMALVNRVEQVVRAVMQPTKINLAALGNMVPHLHWHVIPRYADDAHFPGAIWAAPQRAVAADALAHRQALASVLPLALQQALSAELH
jgi:diadenosine tetraphosphate (Ap4A) HIT family hydrolase